MTFALTRPALRLLLSAGVIFATLAAIAGVSSALLTTNPASANDNTFTTATAGLQISLDTDNNGADGYDTTLTGFNSANLIPGETRTFTFWLRNNSSADLDLNIFGDLSNFRFKNGDTVISAGSTDLDTNLNVSFSCDNEGSSTGGDTPSKNLTNSGWNTSATSGQEQFDENGTLVLGSQTTNDEAKCTMNVTLDAAATNSNHSALFDAIFTGTQVAPAPSPT